MAKLEVLKFPDPRLREVCAPVDGVTPQLQKLAEDMLETMYSEHGIGLAAAQVGQRVRLLVMDTRPKKGSASDEERYELVELSDLEQKVAQPLVIFNPEILEKHGKTTYQEGCLSVPTYYETVERFERIKVRGLNKDGQKIEFELDGLMSICMQHEIDHLDGKLFVDRLSLIKANRIKNRIRKLGYPEPEELDALDPSDQPSSKKSRRKD